MKKKNKGRSRKFYKESKVIDIDEARQNRREKRGQIQEKKTIRRRPTDPRRKRKIRKTSRRIAIYAVIIALILSLTGFSVYKIIDLRMEQKQLKAQHQQLKEKKQRLSEELKNVNDPEYIEQQARKQLNLVMPGETLYVLPDDKIKSSD